MGRSAIFASLIAFVAACAPALAAQDTSNTGYTFNATSDLVLVNVVVRDKDGKFVEGLNANDFTVLEDGKAQHIAAFDIERPDAATSEALPGAPQIVTGKLGATAPPAPTNLVAAHDRRLIVLLFDLTSMQPEEVERAVVAAQGYLAKQMAPADLVAIATLGDSLQVVQDFTSDRAKLDAVLRRINGTEGQGFEPGSTSSSNVGETGQQFTADDTEYNLFNVDRRLQAIQKLTQVLAPIQQKKALIYFSNGMERQGLENQAELRATTNAAIRANVSIYAVDVRGLLALPPGGDAQSASLRGTAAYSGAAVQSSLDSTFATQETLTTLAEDTGGKALLDTNDLGVVFKRVQQDTGAYYVIGYRSSNRQMDGSFRHIAVRLDRKDVKVDFRKGYFAGRDFAHFTKEDRDQQMDDVLTSDLPMTDLPVYASAEFFRADKEVYFVPVSIAVPMTSVPDTNAKHQATLDIVGVVREESSHFPVGSVRDSLKIAVEAGAHKNIQYETLFRLPPGKYDLKIVVREDGKGTIGTFEAVFAVPDMKKVPLKMSSVVMATQSRPASKGESPLVVGKTEIVPNMSHVFLPQQNLTLLYEVYDPSTSGKASDKTHAPHVISYAQFFRGAAPVYQTDVLEAHTVTDGKRQAVVQQLQVPLAQLKPGWYTCQVTAIDDVAGTFTFVRMPIRVVAPAP